MSKAIKPSNKNQTRKLVSAKTVVDYYLKRPETGAPLFIFLHGFGETYYHLLEHFIDQVPSNAGILAPNGVFPYPQKKPGSNEWKLRYCWYFYDSAKSKYHIDQRYPSEVISNLVKVLGLLDLETIIIGYSQGGYLAPFLGNELNHVTACISINAEYKHLMLPKKMNFPLINICGKDDVVVDPENCASSHQILMKQGNKGSFHLVNDSDHRLCPKIIETALSQIAISMT